MELIENDLENCCLNLYDIVSATDDGCLYL